MVTLAFAQQSSVPRDLRELKWLRFREQSQVCPEMSLLVTS